MMLVHDAYCLFNRLRGMNIVSPQDFMACLKMCDPAMDKENRYNIRLVDLGEERRGPLR